MEIYLTQGLVALCDEIDFPFLNQWTWRAVKNKARFYAARSRHKIESPGSEAIFMHQAILARMGLSGTPDHKSGDGLDNRRENLRASTSSQNSANRVKHRTNTSGYKGVHKLANGQYQANIQSKHIGTFWCPKQAAVAYNIEATKLYGEFARLNEV